MAKVLEYRSMLSVWKTIKEIHIDANDSDWIEIGRRNYKKEPK